MSTQVDVIALMQKFCADGNSAACKRIRNGNMLTTPFVHKRTLYASNESSAVRLRNISLSEYKDSRVHVLTQADYKAGADFIVNALAKAFKPFDVLCDVTVQKLPPNSITFTSFDLPRSVVRKQKRFEYNTREEWPDVWCGRDVIGIRYWKLLKWLQARTKCVSIGDYVQRKHKQPILFWSVIGSEENSLRTLEGIIMPVLVQTSAWSAEDFFARAFTCGVRQDPFPESIFTFYEDVLKQSWDGLSLAFQLLHRQALLYAVQRVKKTRAALDAQKENNT